MRVGNRRVLACRTSLPRRPSSGADRNAVERYFTPEEIRELLALLATLAA